jgi:hypothetical protein
MTYTTDANYLIQGGKDLAAANIEASRITGRFNAESTLPWHEWGPVYQELGNAYTEGRDALLDCMEETVALLAAYSVALQDTGGEYLAQEERARRLIEGTR